MAIVTDRISRYAFLAGTAIAAAIVVFMLARREEHPTHSASPSEASRQAAVSDMQPLRPNPFASPADNAVTPQDREPVALDELVEDDDAATREETQALLDIVARESAQ